MDKKVVVVGMIVAILLTVGLSGCTEPTKTEYRTDNAKILLEQVHFEGFGGAYRGKIWVVFEYRNLDETQTLCKMNKLDYVLYGNTHYIGGGEITHEGMGSFENEEFLSQLAHFDDYIQIYEDDIDAPMKPIVYIHPELRSALENETSIEWSVRGELSFYALDSILIEIPFDLTYYQTIFD